MDISNLFGAHFWDGISPGVILLAFVGGLVWQIILVVRRVLLLIGSGTVKLANGYRALLAKANEQRAELGRKIAHDAALERLKRDELSSARYRVVLMLLVCMWAQIAYSFDPPTYMSKQYVHYALSLLSLVLGMLSGHASNLSSSLHKAMNSRLGATQ